MNPYGENDDAGPARSGAADPAQDALDALLRAVHSLEVLARDDLLLTAAAEAARGPWFPGGPALPLDEVRRHVDVIIGAVLAAARGGEDRDERLRRADRLAEDRAVQQIPLVQLLNGFATARRLIVDAVIRDVGSAVPAPLLLAGLTELDRETLALHDRMIIVYQKTATHLARSRRDIRLEALRRLLTDGDRDAMRDLGLDETRRYRLAVADVSAPDEAQQAEEALTSPDGVSGLVNGYLYRLTTYPLDEARVAQLLVVVSPPVPVEDLPAVNVLGRHALELARRHGRKGLRSLGDETLGLVLDSQPLLGRLLASELLPGLDPSDPFHHELVRTASAYLASGRRVQAASSMLGVHVNTVTYRLRRLGELTGLSADEAGHGLDRDITYWWAMESWRRSNPR